MKHIKIIRMSMSLLVILSCSCEQKTGSETTKGLDSANDSDLVDSKKKQVEVSVVDEVALKESDDLEGFIDYGSLTDPLAEDVDLVITESRIENPLYSTRKEKRSSKIKQAEQDAPVKP